MAAAESGSDEKKTGNRKAGVRIMAPFVGLYEAFMQDERFDTDLR